MSLELNRKDEASSPWPYSGPSKVLISLNRKGPGSSVMTVAGPCPLCDGELHRSRLQPHGEDTDGVIYMARLCPTQGLMFGRAADKSWSVPVSGMLFRVGAAFPSSPSGRKTVVRPPRAVTTSDF
jgi:hypothetical protein